MRYLLVMALAILMSCEKVNPVKLPQCPDCGEIGCIYEDIDSMSNGTDQSTYDAIMYISRERELNEGQIKILLTEYYL